MVGFQFTTSILTKEWTNGQMKRRLRNPKVCSQLNKWWNLLKFAQLSKTVIKLEMEIEISQDFLGNFHSYFLHCSGNPVQIICVTSPWSPGSAVWILCWLKGTSIGWGTSFSQLSCPVPFEPQGCSVCSEEERGYPCSIWVSSEAGRVPW